MNKWGALCLLPLVFACNKPKPNSGNSNNGNGKNKLAKANLTGAKSLFIAKSQGRGGESQNTSKLYKLVEENGKYKHVEVSFTDELGEVISSNISVSKIFNLEKGFILLTLDNSSTGANLLLVNKTTGDIFAVPGYYSLYSSDEETPIKTIPGVSAIYLRADGDVARIDYTNPSNPTVKQKILTNKGVLSANDILWNYEIDKYYNIFYRHSGGNAGAMAGMSWENGGTMGMVDSYYLHVSTDLYGELFYIEYTDTTTTIHSQIDGHPIQIDGSTMDIRLIDGLNKSLGKKTRVCDNLALYQQCSFTWIQSDGYYIMNIKDNNSMVLYNFNSQNFNREGIGAFMLLNKNSDGYYDVEKISVNPNDLIFNDRNIITVIDEENALVWKASKDNIIQYFIDVNGKKLSRKNSSIVTKLTRIYDVSLMGNKKIQVTGLLSDKDARVIIEFDENLNQKIISEIELNAEIVNLIKLN